MKEWIEIVLNGMRMLFKMGLNGELHNIAAISGGGRMFLEVLYRSMTAGGIVLAILLLRVILRRVPKFYSYLLWGIVLYRLLCPFTFISSYSFLGVFDSVDAGRMQKVEPRVSAEIQENGDTQERQAVQTGGEAFGTVQEDNEEVTLSRNGRVFLWAAFHIWEAGIAGILLYGFISLFRLSGTLKGAVRLRDNIYLSDYVPTPFVIGVLRPKIYLPSSLTQKEMEYIILHEKTHIRRGDHIMRIFSFLALAIYWFHPLIWAAFYLSEQDMEMSCDEAVMRKMETDIRADYSASLLYLSTGRLFSSGTPLTFGEGDTKKRIENVMHWQRPRPVVTGIALAAVAAAVVLFGTDPGIVEAGSQKLRQTADVWAQAVCDRDGSTILNLSTKKQIQALKKADLLSGEEGVYSFGWSSPWPWDAGKDYRIVECTQQDTVILYYAWTSDPHVTVWREHVTWEEEGSEYRAGESSVLFMDDLSDGDSFYRAYPEGINGTPMDYRTNGAGEALNENALQNKESSEYYQGLFAPETAVRSLLNISWNEEEAVLSAGSRQTDGSVEVNIYFPKDSTGVTVKMIQPYGADGIWIPQD